MDSGVTQTPILIKYDSGYYRIKFGNLGRSTGRSSLTNLLKHGVIYDSIISMFNCSKGVESI